MTIIKHSYLMAHDPYPLETISFQSMPRECPLHFLDYGILTEKVQDKVKEGRRKNKNKRIDHLIDHTLRLVCKKHLTQLFNWGKKYPENAVIKNLSITTHLQSSHGIKELIKQNDIPLAYIEDIHKDQMKGKPKFKKGDWVKFLYGPDWGVVTGDWLHTTTIEYTPVYTMYYRHPDDPVDPDKDYYPDFSTYKIMASSTGTYRQNRHKNPWELIKVGEDTPEWLTMREKRWRRPSNMI